MICIFLWLRCKCTCIDVIGSHFLRSQQCLTKALEAKRGLISTSFRDCPLDSNSVMTFWSLVPSAAAYVSINSTFRCAQKQATACFRISWRGFHQDEKPPVLADRFRAKCSRSEQVCRLHLGSGGRLVIARSVGLNLFRRLHKATWAR